MPSVKDNDLILAIRMRELCRPPTAWNRSLWSVSTQTMLREALEAAEVRRDGILSDASVSDLQSSASILVGKDPGVGDGKVRKHLQQFFNGKAAITPNSLAAANVQMAIDDLEANYLRRWAAEADKGVTDAMLEQCARCVVSHLLNRGHSAEIIASSIRAAVLAPNSTIASAGDLIRELHSVASAASITFRAVFPVSMAPRSKSLCKGWMQGPLLSKWLKQNPVLSPKRDERVVGAVTMEITARDHLAAAEKAAAHFAIICDRAGLGGQTPLVPFKYFWLSGRPEEFPIRPTKRGVEVASIDRQDQIYDIDPERSGIDRAIALLAEHDHGPSSSAVTSGWAALESLAMGPAESEGRAETAVRIASLVTTSFPRAELTTLAYSYSKANKDEFAADLEAASTNRDRAEKMMDRLKSGAITPFRRVEDAAAAMRMRQLMADPVNTLKRINQYVECALKRLYRLRNLVAHGGRTDSIVLEAGVRTAAPLIGAAFDRIHHASISEELTPVELIARAQLRISMLDPAKPTELTRLLE